MHWRIIAVAALFVTSGKVRADESSAPPAWMVRGFEAAIADPKARSAAIHLSFSKSLLLAVRADQRIDIIDKLLPLLGSPDSKVQAEAAQALTAVPTGERASEVIGKLLPHLDSKDSGVQAAAAGALASISPGEHAEEVIGKLLPLLGSWDSSAQGAAAQALAAIGRGAWADEVIGKLLPLLGSENSLVQSAAAKALAAIPPGERADEAIGKLLPLLGSENPFAQAAAAKALAAIGPGKVADEVIGKLLPLLGSRDSHVRAAAAEALAAIPPGRRADEVIGKLLPLLLDWQGGVRPAAARALAAIPPSKRADEVIGKLLPLLGSQDSDVQGAAAKVLAAIGRGERANEVISKLLPMLESMDPNVRAAAAGALAAIPPGERANEVIGKLLPLLWSPDWREQEAAPQALAAIGRGGRADEVIGKLLPLLGSEDFRSWVQAAAAKTLAGIPSRRRANEVISKLLPMLESTAPNVPAAAAGALAAIPPGRRADEVIRKLLPLLESWERSARVAAAQALAAIPPGERADEVIVKLLPLLGSQLLGSQVYDYDIQAAAAQALAAIPPGERANEVVIKLLPVLESKELRVRAAGVQALANAGPGGTEVALSILADVHDRGTTDAPQLRAIGHIVTGADTKHEGSESLLAWLGKPLTLPLASIANNPSAAHDVLKTFEKYWPAIAVSAGLRQEAEGRAVDIAHAACGTPAEGERPDNWLNATLFWIRNHVLEGPVHRCWTSEQRRTVEHLLGGFQEAGYKDALEAHLAREKTAPTLKWLTWSVAGWIVFWGAFLFAFPWSRTVQAVFFWNPKVRNMLSLWFVPLLLLCLPPLRRRLLIPFRDDLVATARLADLPRLAFFGQSRARVGDKPPVTIETLLQGLQGVVVLRGDAGLGKTSALRWFAAWSVHPVAFLAARDCALGVDAAIAHLIRDVQETAFVRSIVYSGALIVIVDGLNEVSADTREKIGAFARDMSKGNVLIGTQPIEWTPPPGAKVVDLLPLSRQEAESFLLSRSVAGDERQKVHGTAYADAVHAFLHHALDEASSEENRRAAELVLSNPFDLTFAADLLAQGSQPSATALIDEAFRLADEGAPGEPGYRDVAGQPFPLRRFGNLAVAMRLEDRNWFKPEEFAAELLCLLQRRLLVQRAVRGPTGVEERVQFRHDRVWDFFIAAAFLNDPDLWADHLGDPRFRGAYLRIAETWEPDVAAKVLDRLNVTAAECGDHTTSDEFIKRLEARWRSRERVRFDRIRAIEKSAICRP